MDSKQKSPPPPSRAYFLLGTLVTAYIGVYLCRKNMSVAVPLLQRQWNLSKEQVGIISSVSTFAYACGKFIFGPVTDRIGGRTSLVASLLLVGLFGFAGAWAPSLVLLTVFYSANRLCGSASWGAMLKMTPEWFSVEKLPFACALLSLSFVFGGALALGFGGLVARFSHDSTVAVLGVPSVVVIALAAAVWFVLPKSKREPSPARRAAGSSGLRAIRILPLLLNRKFLVVMALSFTLTLLRETFNFWTVDFIRTEGGAKVSDAVAAFLSTPFDICGAVGIVLMGWVFGRLAPKARQVLLVVILGLLSLLLLALPAFFHLGMWALSIGAGLIGFLVYGPYSLLGGILSVEVGGQENAATVSGMVDGAGYIAGFLSGIFFGKLLMIGGYRLGFEVMAGLTLLSAVLCCFLYKKPSEPAATLPLPITPTPSVISENP